MLQDYGTLLASLRQSRGLSQRALARALNMNPSVLHRTERGERDPAGELEIAAVAEALNLTAAEHSQLLAAAGYWPKAYRKLGPTDPTLLAVATVLTDEEIPQSVKDTLRAAIETLIEMVRLAREHTREEPQRTNNST